MSQRILLTAWVGLLLNLAAITGFAREDSSAAAAGQAAGAQNAAAEAPPRKPRHRGGLPDDIEGLQQTAIEAYEAGEHLRFVQATIKLRNLRPYEPQYLIGMVVGTALLGRQTSAYSYMHKMQEQGLSFDFNSTDDTESIRGTEVYDYINDLLVRAGDPLGEAEVAFRLPEADSYPEAIVWDPTRERFLTGAVDTGEILAVSKSGEVESLLKPDADTPWWSVHGLSVDAERNRLWVSTTAVPAFRDVPRNMLGASALLEFTLDELELVGRFPVPGDSLPHLLGSSVVHPSGDVFVIDRALPMLYRKAAGGAALEAYLGNKELVGFRDIALSADGKRLYLADAALGVMVVLPDDQKSTMLAAPESLNLGGISGLAVSGNALMMIQNGIRPQRVMRLELDPSGLSVVEVKPVANALETFNFPSFAAAHGDSLWYFASSNVPGANEGLVEPLVLKSPLEPDEMLPTAAETKFQEDTFGKD
ncbi:hypothetical protein [Elongatibacter sediminis]|uniref:SMP-30/Gluconolactonase/LRE-like region domain-containing protein n=1 Tax=Elongatibacter sediminis TaxID=3119006 RepID=A0AAW9RHX1_9GAMM